MSIIRHLLAAVLVLGGLCFMPGTARAAQSYDNCTGFIDSVPTTISTQGVWCLRHNLGTSITSGNAITIATNNVTIDCNDFKVGGLAAGDASNAIGIYASGRQNAIVRHCNVRGFYEGILFEGGAGHLVEDNRLDNNLWMGIELKLTDNSMVRRNRVFDTGGAAIPTYSAIGIKAAADILENTVSGVFATNDTTIPGGISAAGNGTTVQGNRVRGLVGVINQAIGLAVPVSHVTVDGNQIYGNDVGSGINGGANSIACSNNAVMGFSTNAYGCAASIDNIYLP